MSNFGGVLEISCFVAPKGDRLFFLGPLGTAMWGDKLMYPADFPLGRGGAMALPPKHPRG